MISSRLFMTFFADVKKNNIQNFFLNLPKKIKYLCHYESQDDEESKLKTAN